jgi:flavin reductase (DIM6/NTAB) family NADH-FMN oxidoreductase RutF
MTDVSIHSEHPFLPREESRDPLRRFRGRMLLPVTVWTSAHQGRRAGWTVSSVLVADGEPPELLGLLDEDSELADLLPASGSVAVSLLGWSHRGLADAFARTAPAPGGPFRLADWRDTAWGPVLADAPAWLGARLTEPGRAGWSVLVRGVVERVEIGPQAPDGLLGYLRGRYRAVPPDGASEIR